MVVRVRRLLWAACCIASVSSIAEAARPHAGARIAADTLTALPAAHVAKPLRTSVPMVAMAVPPAAWMSLAGTGHWEAAWDPATGVPRRIWGSGIASPGANRDAAIAEQAARAMLAAHLDLLAPGAALVDFQLVSNTNDGEIRTVGFEQFAAGHRVVGGQLSFWFEHDRLFVISSQALPHVVFTQPRARLDRAALAAPNDHRAARGREPAGRAGDRERRRGRAPAGRRRRRARLPARRVHTRSTVGRMAATWRTSIRRPRALSRSTSSTTTRPVMSSTVASIAIPGAAA